MYDAEKDCLIRHLAELANSLAEVYRNTPVTSDNFQPMHIAFGNFYEGVTKNKVINFDELDRDAALCLGFLPFDESGLMLIPVYLVPLIPNNYELISIDGERITYVSTASIMDSNNKLDTLYGCIKYGIELR